MFSSRIVLLLEGRASLFLCGAKFDNEGNLLSGFVENGCWDFRIKNGEELAKDGLRIVNRWPAKLYEIIDVKGVKGDYNEVMRWAESQSVYNTLKE